MKKKPLFEKETDLCAAFMKLVPAEWQAYAETGGFDILLVRKADGFQIGIEAKLKLNAKVICQAAERQGHYYVDQAGPDCRAVLVPADAGGDLGGVCHLLGIEVIRLYKDERWSYVKAALSGGIERTSNEVFYFRPDLPRADRQGFGWGGDWKEFFPMKRLELPDYVPDTIAGDKCPITLTDWKIRAMKLAILLEKTGTLTRQDFKKLGVSISRWTQGGFTYSWLLPGTERGIYIKGNNWPDFRAQHPVNYQQIEADFEKWNPRKGVGDGKQTEASA